MRIANVRAASMDANRETLSDLGKYAHTLTFQRKLDASKQVLDAFIAQTDNPIISCGGGKDGTAIALLAKLIGADVPYVTANPPNPLPDREQHNQSLMEYLGGEWHIVPYDWDVRAVLDGEQDYPDGLKMRKLSEFQHAHRVDGVIFGIRAAESRARRINLAQHGMIYKLADGTMRCQPIARWTAEDSLCLALLMDAPINPVYVKMDGVGSMEQLHDGTWWPHGLQDRTGWIRRYYPEYLDLYNKALLIGASKGECNY